MQKPRINEVRGKGSCRICFECGDVKIWDYPNQRKCPKGKRHRWRPVEYNELSKEGKESIDLQVKLSQKDGEKN